jgi:hypothetical protein
MQMRLQDSAEKNKSVGTKTLIFGLSATIPKWTCRWIADSYVFAVEQLHCSCCGAAALFLQGLQLHVHDANPVQTDRVQIPFELFAAAKSAGRDIYWNIIVASSFLLLLLFLQVQELHAYAHNT